MVLFRNKINWGEKRYRGTSKLGSGNGRSTFKATKKISRSS